MDPYEPYKVRIMLNHLGVLLEILWFSESIYELSRVFIVFGCSLTLSYRSFRGFSTFPDALSRLLHGCFSGRPKQNTLKSRRLRLTAPLPALPALLCSC